jgi:hypothetical protein
MLRPIPVTAEQPPPVPAQAACVASPVSTAAIPALKPTLPIVAVPTPIPRQAAKFAAYVAHDEPQISWRSEGPGPHATFPPALSAPVVISVPSKQRNRKMPDRTDRTAKK